MLYGLEWLCMWDVGSRGWKKRKCGGGRKWSSGGELEFDYEWFYDVFGSLIGILKIIEEVLKDVN